MVEQVQVRVPFAEGPRGQPNQANLQVGDLVGCVDRGQPVMQVAPPAVDPQREQLPQVCGLVGQFPLDFGVDQRRGWMHGEIVPQG